MELILLNPFFQNYVLPFLLVFTLIFAILEKTEVLGKGKKQVSAIISLVVGLILIAFPYARNMIVVLMPFLAVVAVILFVFMILYAFAAGKKENVLNKRLKILFGILIGISLAVMVIYASGKWDSIFNFIFKSTNSSQVWMNVLIVLVLVGAVIAVVASGKGSSSSSSSDE